jgi:hypothetical protein
MKILQEITQLILTEANVGQYIAKAKKHDWSYFFSDSRRAYSDGRKSESELQQIYDSLSDEDKLTAAKWFKDNYPINDNSSLSKAIKNWDVDNDGIDGFNGTHYSIK